MVNGSASSWGSPFSVMRTVRCPGPGLAPEPPKAGAYPARADEVKGKQLAGQELG